MEFVKIAHPDIEAPGECALQTLPLWEGRGWRRVDSEPDVIDLSPTKETPVPPKASRRAATPEE